MSTKSSKAGRPQNEVWDYYTQGDRDANGHANATCNFCNQKFNRGEVTILQGHIANHCLKSPAELIRKYQTMFEEKGLKNKKRKSDQGQSSLHDYHDSDETLPQQRIDRINRSLLKFFICCGISFHIVESPFFADFVQELNASYDLPSRELLSNRLFEDELGSINSKVTKELNQINDLTLGILIQRFFKN